MCSFSLSMNILCIYCQGTPFAIVHALRRAIQSSHPLVCFLIEMRKFVAEMDKVKRKLGFEALIVVPSKDHKQRLALL